MLGTWMLQNRCQPLQCGSFRVSIFGTLELCVNETWGVPGPSLPNITCTVLFSGGKVRDTGCHPVVCLEAWEPSEEPLTCLSSCKKCVEERCRKLPLRMESKGFFRTATAPVSSSLVVEPGPSNIQKASTWYWHSHGTASTQKQNLEPRNLASLRALGSRNLWENSNVLWGKL